MTVVKIVVPRRSDGGRRDQLWAFVKGYWQTTFPEWTITEGHDDDGPFNRGAAVNEAARQAGKFDVLLIVDGDVICDEAQVRAAVARAVETGRMSLPYDEYRALDRRMTDQVLGGFVGDWGRGRFKMTTHISSVVAVPSKLWAEVGGFDERIEGHGMDDVVLAHACRVLGGGIERIPGIVWHLWHPKSPEDDRKARTRIAGDALSRRFIAEYDPTRLRALIAERDSSGAVLIVVTHGRRECITKTIPAALKNLKGIPIERVVICDDSADLEYQCFLRLTFPEAEVVAGVKPGGFSGNTRRAWDVARGDGRPWVVIFEDDFILERPVDLAAMAEVISAEGLLQMVLKRQPWFPAEIEAGGFMEADPDRYRDEVTAGHEWVSFDAFWTNPYLAPRQTFVNEDWPSARGSEAIFARYVKQKHLRSGYWGPLSSDPIVTHIGDRDGTGY